MQQQQIQRLLEELSRQSGNPDAVQTAQRLRQLLSTPQGRQAAQAMLHNPALAQAARYAQSGNLDAAGSSIRSLMGTPEGAQLAAQLAAWMGR